MLQGKTILITGGGSGIGKGAALMFARHGANVVVTGRRKDALDATVAEIDANGGEALACQGDVSSAADVQRAVDLALGRYGRLDGAFNNAGVEGLQKPLTELSEAEWRHCIDVDLTGVFLCMKAQIIAMAKTGGGAIVNNSSGLGVMGVPCMGEYIAAKHGLIGLTRAGAAEYAMSKVRVNAIIPGVTQTPMLDELIATAPAVAALMEGFKARISMGRFGTAEDAAEATMWLLSERSSYVNGTILPVDGGYCAR